MDVFKRYRGGFNPSRGPSVAWSTGA